MAGGTIEDDMQIQFRYAGPTTQTSSYLGMSYASPYNGTSLTFTGQTNTTQLTLWDRVGGADYFSSGVITVNAVGDGSRKPLISGYAQNGNGHYGPSNFGGLLDSARVYTGFLLKSSSSNITGTVAVYGLAK